MLAMFAGCMSIGLLTALSASSAGVVPFSCFLMEQLGAFSHLAWPWF